MVPESVSELSESGREVFCKVLSILYEGLYCDARINKSQTQFKCWKCLSPSGQKTQARQEVIENYGSLSKVVTKNTDACNRDHAMVQLCTPASFEQGLDIPYDQHGSFWGNTMSKIDGENCDEVQNCYNT